MGLFTQFSEGARKVIFYAVYEASERNQTHATPEDIVLGVLRISIGILTINTLGLIKQIKKFFQ